MIKKVTKTKAISILAIGCLAGSFAVIFIRLCQDNSILIANYRLLFASIILFPFWISKILKKKNEDSTSITTKKIWNSTGIIIPGVLLGLHFMNWVWAVKLTTIANATLIGNIQILLIPIFGFLFLKEHITKKEILGILLAFIGVLIVGLGDFRLAHQHFKGDLVTLSSTFFFSLYILFGRKFRRIVNQNGNTSHLIEYIFPVYTTASLFIILFCLISGISLKIRSWESFFWMLMLAIIPTIMGHSLINWSLRYVKPQLISLFILGQFPVSTVLAYILFSEIPKHLFYLGAPFVILGIIVGLHKKE